MTNLIKVKLITPSTKRVTINIPNPYMNMSAIDAAELMTSICGSNCFIFEAGRPVAPDCCELITTEEKPLTD